MINIEYKSIDNIHYEEHGWSIKDSIYCFLCNNKINDLFTIFTKNTQASVISCQNCKYLYSGIASVYYYISVLKNSNSAILSGLTIYGKRYQVRWGERYYTNSIKLPNEICVDGNGFEFHLPVHELFVSLEELDKRIKKLLIFS